MHKKEGISMRIFYGIIAGVVLKWLLELFEPILFIKHDRH